MPKETQSADSPAPLDYEIVRCEDAEGWAVWTPNYDMGGCLGVGKTKKKALENTIRNMELTIDKIMGAKTKPV